MTSVVCLHCSGSSSRQWNRLAADLASECAVLTPELIGYDRAARWTRASEPTLDDEAARIEAIVDNLRGPVFLVGHSYGAAVATRVALHRLDRIVGLALYEPVLFALIARDAAGGDGGREIVATGLAIQAHVRAGRVEQAARSFVDYWSGEGTWEAMDARRRLGVCARMRKVAQEFAALFADPLPLAAYARLTMPVLWLEGEKTRLPPRAVARRLLPALADVRQVSIVGAGHMGPLTHPHVVNAEIVHFVRAVAQRRRLGIAA